MKKLNLIFLLGIIMSCILSLTSCKDESLSEKLGHEAKIMISFKVKGTSGTVFNSSIGDDNTITIKVSPYLDAVEELKSAIPTFYLSKGSTVTQRYLIYHILPAHLPQNLHGWQPHESAFRFWQNSDSGAVPLTENRNRSVSLVPVLIPEGPPDKP